MSEDTKVRKERRKIYFAKLKREFDERPVGDKVYANAHGLNVQEIAGQILAATQQAFHDGASAAFNMQHVFYERINAAYHDGFMEGYNFSQTSNVAINASSHFHEEVIDWIPAQSCKLEPRILSHHGAFTVHTPDTCEVEAQTGTGDSLSQSQNLEPIILSHHGAFTVHTPDTCEVEVQTGTGDSLFQSQNLEPRMSQQVTVDSFGLEPRILSHHGPSKIQELTRCILKRLYGSVANKSLVERFAQIEDAVVVNRSLQERLSILETSICNLEKSYADQQPCYPDIGLNREGNLEPRILPQDGACAFQESSVMLLELEPRILTQDGSSTLRESPVLPPVGDGIPTGEHLSTYNNDQSEQCLSELDVTSRELCPELLGGRSRDSENESEDKTSNISQGVAPGSRDLSDSVGQVRAVFPDFCDEECLEALLKFNENVNEAIDFLLATQADPQVAPQSSQTRLRWADASEGCDVQVSVQHSSVGYMQEMGLRRANIEHEKRIAARQLEKEQKRGIVSAFLEDKGYGFIREGDASHFVHINNVIGGKLQRGDGWSKLQRGDQVVFRVQSSARNPGSTIAVQVSVLKSAPAAGNGGDAPYKTKLCNFWMQGACARGAGCTYAHGKHELGGGDVGGGI